MKKILAIVFTLIFALSACTVAFAATATTTVDCSVCKMKFDDNAAYNAHLADCKAANTETLHKWECCECHKVFKDEATFNAHYYGGGCDVLYASCKYCEERILKDATEEHYGLCIKYSEVCEFCGEEFDTKAKFEAHNCEVLGFLANEDIAKIVGTVIIAIKNIDWEEVLGKIGEVLGGIDFEGLIGKVTGLFGDIDFEDLLGKVTGLFGDIDLEGLGK